MCIQHMTGCINKMQLFAQIPFQAGLPRFNPKYLIISGRSTSFQSEVPHFMSKILLQYVIFGEFPECSYFCP